MPKEEEKGSDGKQCDEPVPMSQQIAIDGSAEGDIVYAATKLCAIDGQGALVECIKKHERRAGVVWRGFLELHSFVLTASGRDECARLGGMEMVVDALSNFAARDARPSKTSRLSDKILLLNSSVVSSSGASGACPGPPSRKASKEVVRPVTALVSSDEPPDDDDEAPSALNTRGAFRLSRARIARQRAVDAWTCASAL